MPRVEQRAAAARIDAAGTIVEADPDWDARLERHGVEILRRAEILGRPLSEFLDARRAEGWLRFLDRLRQSKGPPPASEDPLLARLRPWPAGVGSVWLSLEADVVERWLKPPLLRLQKGRVLGCNRSARKLLAARPDLSELRQLESFLASRQPSLRLVPTRELRFAGRPVFFLRRPSLYDVEAFDLLARIVRAGLHDLSNPLSAMRMMAEVTARGGNLLGESSPGLSDVTGYLDVAIETIHGLRSLIYADGSAAEINVAKELRIIASLLRSELSRREIELEIEVPPAALIVAGANAFRLFLCAGLLSTCSRTTTGNRLRLEWCESTDVRQLSCWIEGERSLLGDLYPSNRLLERLARSCDGEVVVAPGESGDATPDWRVELSAV